MALSVGFFFFKQKTAYEMRISDWSSDVCASRSKCSKGLGRSAKTARIAPACICSKQKARTQSACPLATACTASIKAVDPVEQLLFTLNTSSEERRVGKECGSTCRSRCSTYH